MKVGHVKSYHFCTKHCEFSGVSTQNSCGLSVVCFLIFAFFSTVSNRGSKEDGGRRFACLAVVFWVLRILLCTNLAKHYDHWRAGYLLKSRCVQSWKNCSVDVSRLDKVSSLEWCSQSSKVSVYLMFLLLSVPSLRSSASMKCGSRKAATCGAQGDYPSPPHWITVGCFWDTWS